MDLSVVRRAMNKLVCVWDNCRVDKILCVGKEVFLVSIEYRNTVEPSVSAQGRVCMEVLGDLLEVSSQINAVPYLALAMEQCWLSDTARPASHARPQDTK